MNEVPYILLGVAGSVVLLNGVSRLRTGEPLWQRYSKRRHYRIGNSEIPWLTRRPPPLIDVIVGLGATATCILILIGR